MKKDDFWSVDKLLPPIRLSTDFSHKNGAVPISSLEESLPLKNWGERITVPNSRVILSYRLTEPIFTPDVALGEDFGYPENDRPPFVSCTFYSPSLRMLTAEMRRLPDSAVLEAQMRKIGFPTLTEIGVTAAEEEKLFAAAPDIRDKYVQGRLLWDLGLSYKDVRGRRRTM